MLVVLLLHAGMACAADVKTLDVWRNQVSRTRQLAENDPTTALREVQRLQSTLPADAAPADRARILNLQSRIENYLMRTEHALAHAKQAQAWAAQHGDRIGQAEADLNLALVAISQGQLTQLDEAVPHCMEMLEGANRPELLSEAMLLAVGMYRRKGLLENSVTIAMRSLELAQHERNALALAYAHWGAVRSFSLSNRSAEAREHAMRMYEQARIAGARRLEATALMEWGRAIAKLGDMRGSEQRIRSAIDIDRRAGMPAALGTDMAVLADVLHLQGNTVAAIKVLDEAVGIYEKHPHKTGLWWLLYARSEYKQALGDDGMLDAERAVRLAREIGMPMYLVKSEQRLAAIAAHRHDWERAYRHTAQAAGVLEETAADQSGERVILLAKRYEKDSERRRIEALTRDIEQQQLRQRWMLTALGGGGLILAGALLFLWSQRRSHRRLAEANRQLQASRDLLWESERHLSNLSANLPGFIYTFRLWPDGHCSFPYTGPGIRELYGLAPEDVQDDMAPLHQRMHADDRPMIEAAIAKSIANLSGFHIEARVQHPIKGEGWIEARSTPVRMPDGGIQWHGLMLDISNRKRMEVLLQTSEHRYRTLAENSPDIIVRYDRACRRLYVNSTYVRVMGDLADEALGKTPSEVFLLDTDAEAYQAELEAAMESGVGREIQMQWLKPEGGWMYYHICIVPAFDDAGQVHGALAIGRDVTRFKEMELRLQESQTMLRVLAERNESILEAERRHLAREVHDELGQMLNVVRLNLLVLDRRFGRDNPEMQGVVGTMLDHLGNTLAIARNIVSALHPAVLDDGVTVALEWLLHEFGKSTSIAHALAVDPDISLDEAQAMAVYRIVQESLTNVARHSGADLIEVSLMRDGAMYRLEVSDNGHGFDISAPRNHQSLGLIGMQERALMLGGRLDLTSSPGEGALLSIEFPVQREDELT